MKPEIQNVGGLPDQSPHNLLSSDEGAGPRPLSTLPKSCTFWLFQRNPIPLTVVQQLRTKCLMIIQNDIS